MPAGALDQWAVLAVRRCKDDGIDRRIGEERIKIIRQHDPVLSAKALGSGARAGVAGSEADCAALALHGIEQRAAPAAEPDNGCLYSHGRLVRHRRSDSLSPVGRGLG